MSDLESKIEPHFKNLITTNSRIFAINSIDLLTWNRFDIAFKLCFLALFKKNQRFANYLYAEHLKAFNFGIYKESGNKDKKSFDDFKKEFIAVYSSISEHGFNSNISIIPIAKGGSIANGSHRVASAISNAQEVKALKLDVLDHCYDYKFFYNRNVPVHLIDSATIKYVETASNVHVAFIWPSADISNIQLSEIIPNVISKKSVILNHNGAHNLVSQVYYKEPWVGSAENNYRGCKTKVFECFNSKRPLKVYVFQSENIDMANLIKERIRDLCQIEKSSIHITDNKEEAIRAVKTIFNTNSIHFLNYANPNKFLFIHEKIKIFQNEIRSKNLDCDDFVIDGSVILSLYGLRSGEDFDYISANEFENFSYQFHSHDSELVFHELPKEDLLYDPTYFFYFNGLKFVTLSQLYNMKKKRLEAKDIIDCELMESLIKNSRILKAKANLKQFIYYKHTKFLYKTYLFLKITRLLPIAKRTLKFLKIKL